MRFVAADVCCQHPHRAESVLRRSTALLGRDDQVLPEQVTWNNAAARLRHRSVALRYVQYWRVINIVAQITKQH